MTDTTTEAVERLAAYCDFLAREDAAPIHDGRCAATLRALAQERDEADETARMYADALKIVQAERDAARAELAEAQARIAWLEEIREGAGRALCAMDGIAPDEPIADGGHVAWELHVYQRAHAALAATEDKQ